MKFRITLFGLLITVKQISDMKAFLGSTVILLGVTSIFLGVTSFLCAAERPNILIIVSDDQGYNDQGCCGNEEIKTPNLDRLASGGVRLTNFYVTWPGCTPSRGSLLTGRYPQRNGTYDMFRNYLVDRGHRYTKHDYCFVTLKDSGGYFRWHALTT